MPRWVPIAALVLALGGVVAYGLLRPGTAPGRDPADVQARLNTIPRTLGAWTAEGDNKLSERTMTTGRFEAYFGRTYTHPKAGGVAVLLVYGEAGDVGTHDPTVCYVGGGYERCETLAKVRIPDRTPTAEFNASKFSKKEQTVAVYWGWGADASGWQAPENPRFAFATHRRLYKLYAQSSESGSPTSDPVAEFLPLFLPALADALPPLSPR